MYAVAYITRTQPHRHSCHPVTGSCCADPDLLLLLLLSVQVRAVFSADPDLLDWVTSMPDNATVERVRACAEQLALCAAQAVEGGASGALLNDAYSILHMLCQTPVSLRCVGATGDCAAPGTVVADHVMNKRCRLSEEAKPSYDTLLLRLLAAATHCQCTHLVGE
jgi:hypothetical protein